MPATSMRKGMYREDSGYSSQLVKRRKVAKAATSKLIKYSMAPRKSRGDNIISITRTYRLNQFLRPYVSCTDGGGYQGVLRVEPRLQDFPDYTDFGALFDEYRITDCNVKVVPRYTDNTATTGDNSMCILSWLTDHNALGVAFDTVEGLWLQREDLKQTLLNKEVNIKFSPRPTNPVNQPGVIGTSSFTVPQWINAADSAVVHYGLGLRIYAPNASLPIDQNMANIWVTCTFQFRQPK